MIGAVFLSSLPPCLPGGWLTFFNGGMNDAVVSPPVFAGDIYDRGRHGSVGGVPAPAVDGISPSLENAFAVKAVDSDKLGMLGWGSWRGGRGEGRESTDKFVTPEPKWRSNTMPSSLLNR